MTVVRTLRTSDVDPLVAHVSDTLAHHARREPLLSGDVIQDVLAAAFRSASDSTWIATEHDAIVGHLHANVLDDPLDGPSAWTGPDGVSANSADDLLALLEVATPHWRDRRARRHHVWQARDDEVEHWWKRQGYRADRVRAARRLEGVPEVHTPDLYRIRRGRRADLDAAVSLDAILEVEQSGGTVNRERLAQSEVELRRTLEDPDTRHYVITYGHEVVGQAVAFELDPMRGNHPRTILVSDVVVRPDHRRRGVAAAVVGSALRDAWERGADYAQVTWHEDNVGAGAFWGALEFTPVYRRFSRDLIL